MVNTEKQMCFVIMPFKEPFDSYFSKIVKPAIESCDLFAVRGDSLFRPSSIMDDVWDGIKSAKVLVAELTERNANVFYELGLAHALSKPVVLLVQSMDDVPFDLRSIRVIQYDKDDPDWGVNLRNRISFSINEILEHPQSAIPSTFKVSVSVKRPEESEVLLRLEKLEQQINRLSIGVAWDGEGGGVSKEDVSINDIVFHKHFGKGVVIDMEGSGDHLRVQVNFENFGMKWLVQKYAGLVPVVLHGS